VNAVKRLMVDAGSSAHSILDAGVGSKFRGFVCGFEGL